MLKLEPEIQGRAFPRSPFTAGANPMRWGHRHQPAGGVYPPRSHARGIGCFWRSCPRLITPLILLGMWFGCAIELAAQALPVESLEIGREALKRVQMVVVEDGQATRAFDPDPERVQRMVDQGLGVLCGKKTAAEAWRSLVTTQDIVGIKVFSSPGAISGTRPAVVAAVVHGLLQAGLPAQHLIVWDRRLSDLRQAGWAAFARRHGIRVAGSEEEGYDEKTFYETALLGQLVWGDYEFGRKGTGIGRKSFVTKLLTQQVTRIINVTPMLNHTCAGVTGNLYGLAMGSVDNILRFEGNPERLASAIPEIYALPVLGDRVVLNIVDALICQYQGEQRELLHYSSVLNQIRFSTDPVALDVISIKELDHQRQLAHIPPVKPDLELYRNASLLEIGVSDERQILIERITLGP